MTKEELAEEYATEISCDEETGEETLFISPTKKQAYLDGLAEGRKEKQVIIDTQTIQIESRDVYLAEKENIILRQQSEIEQLKNNYKKQRNKIKSVNEVNTLSEDYSKIIIELESKISYLEDMLLQEKNKNQ